MISLCGARVNGKSFGSYYIQGRVNVDLKPLLIERIEDDAGLGVDEKEKEDRNRIGVNKNDTDEVEVSPHEHKLSKIEKEAWELLRSSIVNYCGNPVGTVAVNDLSDNQQLNYDQVFIRDEMSMLGYVGNLSIFTDCALKRFRRWVTIC